jgi:hypothetical protein
VDVLPTAPKRYQELLVRLREPAQTMDRAVSFMGFREQWNRKRG